MKIKKIYQGTIPENKILDGYSESQTDTYSCCYMNELINNNVRQLTGYKIIADEADINTIIEHGTYRSESTAHTATMKNVPVVPTGSTGGFTLYVMGYTSTVTNRSFVRQELIIASYTYVRHTTNGGSSWSEWIDMSKDISIITVFSKNQKHTGGNWSVISFKLTSEIKVGNAFTRNTNNTIKVNKNLKGVIASATMNLTTDSYSYSGDLYIIQERDGKTFKQMDCRANDGNGLKHMSTSPVLFNDVKKNDVFYFGHYTNSGSDTFTTVNGDSTYLTLTEVS